MVDDLRRTSEIVVFMVYVEKWSGGGVVSSVDVLVVHESAVLNVGLHFCFFALIEQEESSGASFMLIFWSAFEAKSSIILSYCCLDSLMELRPSIIVLATVSSRGLRSSVSSLPGTGEKLLV